MIDELYSVLIGLPLEATLLVFLRVGAVFFMLPILGSNSVSVRVRALLAIGCSLILLPLMVPDMPVFSTQSAFILACINEVIAGLLVGALVRAVFWAMEIAGTIASQTISLSQILGNQSETPQPAIGQFLYVAALALAAVLNFHVLVLDALADSYALIPPGQSVPHAALGLLPADAVSRAFAIAFGLSGPFLIVAVLYNLCLGIVNKAMPQLMVAFVGAPAITWLGIAVLMVSSPFLMAVWADHLRSFSLADVGR